MMRSKRTTKSSLRNAILLVTSSLSMSLIVMAQPGGTGSASQDFVVMKTDTSLFLPGVVYSSKGDFGNSVAVADLNGDGKEDVVVANGYNVAVPGNAGVGVLLGNGDGSLRPAANYDSGGAGFFANSVAIADVNGDGKLDLLVADSCNDSFCLHGNWVAVLIGKGDGTFRKPRRYRSKGASWAVAVTDVNRDGKPDLVVANVCSKGNDIHTCTAGGSVGILLGNGDGTFQKAQSYPANGFGTYSIAVGDMNGDGKPDAIVSSFSEGNVGVLLGNGDGSFQTVRNYSTGGRANAVVVTDLNGDGKLDVAAPNGGSETLSVLLGNGDGTLQAATIYNVPGYAFAITAGDVNEDGIQDLIVASGHYSVVGAASVFLGNGNGTLQPPTAYSSLEYGADGITIGDLNGDGRPDLLVANECESPACQGSYAGSVTVLIHAATP